MTKFTLGARLALAFPMHPKRTLWWAGADALTVFVLYEPVMQLVRRSRSDRDKKLESEPVAEAALQAQSPAFSAASK